MTFHDRTQKAEQYFQEIAQLFSSRGYKVVKTGVEVNYSHTHPDLMKLDNDLTAKYFRYHPDGFYIAEKFHQAVYFDAKASDSIEKDAYLIYQKMHSIGLRVLVCIKNKKNEQYHVPIQKICLVSGLETAKRNPLPLDEDGWLAPRLLSPVKYQEWKNKCRGSGTSYRYFDFAQMQKFKLKTK
jgi:hypothetical protein